MVVKLAGVAATEKSPVGPGAFTFNETVAVCISVPLVPVTTTLYGPGEVVPSVVMFSVAVPDPVTEPGFIEQALAGSVGQPLILKLTTSLNPFWAVTEMVEEPLSPWVRVREDGLADMEKSEGGFVPPQPGKLKDAIRVLHALPFVG